MPTRTSVGLVTLLAAMLACAEADASPKDDCLEAHGRGQEQRDKGQLSRARQSFLACAQSACPAVVQADCARMSEDASRLLPTVTFVARDASAGDLPATSVFVDDVLQATRLDDGRSYDVDPGRHVVRYVHDGREATIRVVLNQGEKGRVLIATFAAETASAPQAVPDTFAPVIERRSSIAPLIVGGVGALGAITGAVIVAVGMSQVPETCSASTRACVGAGPGDPALSKAADATSLANVGLGVGLTGAAVLVGGLVWYFLQPARAGESPRRGRVLGPSVAAWPSLRF